MQLHEYTTIILKFIGKLSEVLFSNLLLKFDTKI